MEYVESSSTDPRWNLALEEYLFTGAESRKKVSPVLAVLALVFLLKYIFL